MKYIILLSLLSSCLGSYYSGAFPGAYYPGAPITAFNNANPGNGNYDYSYQTGNGISVRESGRLVAGIPEGPGTVAEGSFSFVAPNGRTYTVAYTADENGFHPVGAHLPTQPVVASPYFRPGYNYYP